ncbi:MAG: DUF4834 family protein [Marinilabiliaceae bacterium]|nr:DUF4834 family protein [Marinilabiliaceae bacterium]
MWWRIFLLLFVISYAVKLISELLVSNKIKNAEKRRKKAYDNYINRKKSEEGNVTYDYDEKKRKKRNRNEGEYVDFEEI